MDGFIVFDKPAGVTSHDIVSLVRKACRIKKVGHTGTLDPFATGVLPIAVGEATKAIPFLDESVKQYRAVMKLGETTDTGDCTGTVVKAADWRVVDECRLLDVVRNFIGEISQIPPMYSALKRNGVPLYRLARKGETVEREPRNVTIVSLAIDHVAWPEVGFTVVCSRGTYVRTLAADIGDALGCGAHLVSLKRIASGMFGESGAVSEVTLRERIETGRVGDILVAPLEALSHLPDFALSCLQTARVRCGAIPEGVAGLDAMAVRQGDRLTFSCDNRLVAVAECETGDDGGGDKKLRLLRVFN